MLLKKFSKQSQNHYSLIHQNIATGYTDRQNIMLFPKFSINICLLSRYKERKNNVIGAQLAEGKAHHHEIEQNDEKKRKFSLPEDIFMLLQDIKINKKRFFTDRNLFEKKKN